MRANTPAAVLSNHRAQAPAPATIPMRGRDLRTDCRERCRFMCALFSNRLVRCSNLRTLRLHQLDMLPAKLRAEPFMLLCIIAMWSARLDSRMRLLQIPCNERSAAEQFSAPAWPMSDCSSSTRMLACSIVLRVNAGQPSEVTSARDFVRQRHSPAHTSGYQQCSLMVLYLPGWGVGFAEAFYCTSSRFI